MEIKVLGISGSPVKGGNVEVFLENMLDSISSKPGVRTETVSLANLKIGDCLHCNFCLKHQKEGKYCALEDDAQPVMEKMESSDILVFASPVYFMRTSAHMAALIDRLRMFTYGNLTKGRLKNKVGVSAAVSWVRHGGLETTHLSHIMAFLVLEMIPIGGHNSVSPLGASGVSSPDGSGTFDKAIRTGVEKDENGLKSGRVIMNRAVEIATILKREMPIDKHNSRKKQ
jgi:multimeric flavodoxin WrbA